MKLEQAKMKMERKKAGIAGLALAGILAGGICLTLPAAADAGLKIDNVEIVLRRDDDRAPERREPPAPPRPEPPDHRRMEDHRQVERRRQEELRRVERHYEEEHRRVEARGPGPDDRGRREQDRLPPPEGPRRPR